ncbi:Gamete protein [Arachis hypogaea]|nr:Gamete protein [Arachis hypogaea]
MSAFHVDYTPEKKGFYDIHVYCGNVLLNKGHTLRKEVKAGKELVCIFAFDQKKRFQL